GRTSFGTSSFSGLPPTVLARPGSPVASFHGDRNLLDCVGAVAEPVPFGPLGLGAAGKIGGSGTHKGGAASFVAGQQLPPLPAMPATFADQSGGLPVTACDRYVDPVDGCRTRPCDTAHHQIPCGH